MMNLLRMTFITREKLSDPTYKTPEMESKKGEKKFESADTERPPFDEKGTSPRTFPFEVEENLFLLVHQPSFSMFRSSFCVC
jgi:hypothetical protein